MINDENIIFVDYDEYQELKDNHPDVIKHREKLAKEKERIISHKQTYPKRISTKQLVEKMGLFDQLNIWRTKQPDLKHQYRIPVFQLIE